MQLQNPDLTIGLPSNQQSHQKCGKKIKKQIWR